MANRKRLMALKLQTPSTLAKAMSTFLGGATRTKSLSGWVVLRGADFDDFKACMTRPKKPSRAMVEAEKLHRQMRSR